MDNDTLIHRLKALAIEWGGEICQIPQELYETHKKEDGKGFSEAPFSNADIGVCQAERTIYYTDRVQVKWYELIHELGHLFATPNDIWDDDEFKWFGWEIALARYIGGDLAEWVKGNRDYVVSERGYSLGDIGPWETIAILATQEQAVARCCLVVDGVPQVF